MQTRRYTAISNRLRTRNEMIGTTWALRASSSAEDQFFAGIDEDTDDVKPDPANLDEIREALAGWTPDDTTDGTPAVVYRLYDQTGNLVYVGCTTRPQQRMYQHEREKHWWGEVARVELEQYRSREAAEQRETLLILLHRPPHNAATRSTGLPLPVETALSYLN